MKIMSNCEAEPSAKPDQRLDEWCVVQKQRTVKSPRPDNKNPTGRATPNEVNARKVRASREYETQKHRKKLPVGKLIQAESLAALDVARIKREILQAEYDLDTGKAVRDFMAKGLSPPAGAPTVVPTTAWVTPPLGVKGWGGKDDQCDGKASVNLPIEQKEVSGVGAPSPPNPSGAIKMTKVFVSPKTVNLSFRQRCQKVVKSQRQLLGTSGHMTESEEEKEDSSDSSESEVDVPVVKNWRRAQLQAQRTNLDVKLSERKLTSHVVHSHMALVSAKDKVSRDIYKVDPELFCAVHGACTDEEENLRPVRDEIVPESREPSEHGDEESKSEEQSNDEENTLREIVVEVGGIIRDSRGTYYNLSKDGWFTKYDVASRSYSGSRHPPNYFVVVQPGTELRGVHKVRDGSYISGTDCYTAVGHADIVHNFVVRARELKWLADLRKALSDISYGVAVVSTAGWWKPFDPWGPYKYLSKKTRNIMVDRTMYTGLFAAKVAMGLSQDNASILMKYVATNYNHIPVSIMIDTLLYFTWQRYAIATETQATTDALLKARERGAKGSVYVEPSFGNDAYMYLTRPDGDKCHSGLYTVADVGEVERALSKRATCIIRDAYRTTPDAHGDYDNPVHPPGRKYELLDKASSGVEFDGTYVKFNTRDDPRYKQNTYQSVGCAFLTAAAVVDHKVPTEVEKIVLRLTKERDNEWERRASQVAVSGMVLSMLCRDSREARVSCSELTNRIVTKYDRKYKVDKMVRADSEQAQLAMNLYESISVWMDDQPEAEELAPIIRDYIQAQAAYTIELGGPKRNKRLEEIAYFATNPHANMAQYNVLQQKPHEAQKYKKGVLKYARAVQSVTGLDWVAANPAAFCMMKHTIEHPIIILYDVNENLTKYEVNGHVRTLAGKTMDYDLWYRAVLTDTSHEELAAVIQAMVYFVRGGPSRMAAISHGDDMLSVTENGGELTWIEGDIADNDTSYTDSTVRLEFLRASKWADVVEAYAQHAKPVILSNPVDNNEYAVLRTRTGMGRISGGVPTTFGNSCGSFGVILSYATFGKSKTFTESAAIFGFDVTVENQGPLAEVTFLSRGFIQMNELCYEVKVFTCFASLLRSFGKITGDFPGSSKTSIVNRWKEHVRGVALGWVHEPESLLMRALRDTFAPSLCLRVLNTFDGVMGSSGRLERYRAGAISQNALTPTDFGIIRRYYQESEMGDGVREYVELSRYVCQMQFGSVVASGFIDRVMGKRYGMAPVCG